MFLHILECIFHLETGDSVTTEEFGETWKADGPNENCEEHSSSASQTCKNQVFIWELTSDNYLQKIWHSLKTRFTFTYRETPVKTS